jgi:hypothetical protein
MPRLQRPGPTVVCSVASSRPLVAVGTSDGVRLVDPATREELASTDVGLGADGELLFCTVNGPTGPMERLVVVARGEQASTLTALELPRLGLAGRAIVDGRAQSLYVVRDRVIVGGEIAEVPQVVAIAARGLTVATMAMRGPLLGGAMTPEGHLLVVARDQLERWDPVSRRVLARFNLPIPFERVRALGFAARQRLVWFAIGGPVGAIDVYRFSDGRPQGRAMLPGAFLGAINHPDAERLLVAVREGDAVALREIDVMTQQARLFPGGREAIPVAAEARGFTLVEGEAPMAVTVDGEGQLAWEPLEPAPLWAAVAAERKAREAKEKRDKAKEPAFKVTRPPKLGTSAPTGSAADPRWRERLGSNIPRVRPTADREAVVASAEPVAPRPTGLTTRTGTGATAAAATPRETTGDWRARMGRGRAGAATTVGATAAEHRIEEHAEDHHADADADADLDAAHEQVPEPAHAHEPEETPDVRGFGSARSSEARRESARTRLYAEGMALLTGGAGDADPARHLDGPEGARVVEAFQLDGPARTGLALLYAAWLDGLVDGVSAAQLAEGIARVHRELDDDDAWREALGLGPLGSHGLATMRRGRARLVPAVGRFLDGHPLHLRRVQPPPGAPASPETGTMHLPCTVEDTADPARLAARAAIALGHDVAWSDLEGEAKTDRQRARVTRRALVEAHLGGAVPLFVTSDPKILDLLDGRLAVVAAPSGSAVAFDRLPRLNG